MAKNNTFKEYIQPVVVLAAICLVITFALAFVNSITEPIIQTNKDTAAAETRKELLPEADSFTLFIGDHVSFEDGKIQAKDCYKANNNTGVVVTVETKSFGGKLTMMVGINSDGAVTGIKVIDHSDTKGLGTKAHAQNHLSQYTDISALTATSAKADPDIVPVTGATVSSNAIHYGVYAALEQAILMGGVK